MQVWENGGVGGHSSLDHMGGDTRIKIGGKMDMPTRIGLEDISRISP